jgi:hypothetical protein
VQGAPPIEKKECGTRRSVCAEVGGARRGAAAPADQKRNAESAVASARRWVEPGGVQGPPPINIGAGDRTRTYDLLITNQLLYQLSYAGLDDPEV